MNMATMTVRKIFIDTNILIRATNQQAPFHKECRDILGSLWDQGAVLYMSNQVIREYIANVTRPQTYSIALPIEDVLAQVNDFYKSFQILPDTPPLLNTLLALIRDVPTGGKQIHDANIVATMIVNDIDTLLTLNVVDFKRFENRIKIISLT